MLKEFEPQIIAPREEIIAAVTNLQQTIRVDFHQEQNPPPPWKTVDYFEDMKHIAIAPELGICVKRYFTSARAEMVHRSFWQIKKVVQDNVFPLLLPLDCYNPKLSGLIGDSVVLPYFQHKLFNVFFAPEETAQFIKILINADIKPDLPVIDVLQKLKSDDGQEVLIDPFDDSPLTFRRIEKNISS